MQWLSIGNLSERNTLIQHEGYVDTTISLVQLRELQCVLLRRSNMEPALSSRRSQEGFGAQLLLF